MIDFTFATFTTGFVTPPFRTCFNAGLGWDLLELGEGFFHGSLNQAFWHGPHFFWSEWARQSCRGFVQSGEWLFGYDGLVESCAVRSMMVRGSVAMTMEYHFVADL